MITTPKTHLKTAMAQDLTRAARMVAQGCTKIPTMRAVPRSHQKPIAREAAGALIAPWPRGTILTTKAGCRDAAFRSQPGGVRQTSTPIHQATPHRQTSPSATRPEAAPIPVTAGSDGEPFGGSAKPAHPSRTSAKETYRPSPAMQEMEGSSSQELGQEEHKYMYYIDESSLDDVKSATGVYELEAESRERDLVKIVDDLGFSESDAN